MFSIYYLVWLTFLGITLQQIILSQTEDCQCAQIYSQNECQQLAPVCNWNTTYNQNGSCQASPCSSYNGNYADCSQLSYCYWNGFQCGNFINCGNLSSNPNLACQQQNKNCYGTSGQCQNNNNIPELLDCNQYTIQANCTYSKKGKCYWYNDSCQYYSYCQEVPISLCSTFKPFETKQDLGQYCTNSSNQCVQASCQAMKTKSQCTFVQLNYNIDQFQLCQWNSTLNTCSNAYSTNFLTNETCLTNTMFNYRWIQDNEYTTEGVCFKCQIKPFNRKNQCSCSQLVSQFDCINAKICTWSQGLCTPTSCLSIFYQQQCLEQPLCMWQDNLGCQQFTKCQNLKGASPFKCLSYSLQCGGSNGYNCIPTQISSSSGCQENYNGQCLNLISSEGFCHTVQAPSYSYCQYQPFDSCNNLSMQECSKLRHRCYWYMYNYYYGYGSCCNAQCGYYNTQEACTYIVQGSNYVNCQWQEREGCYQVNNGGQELNFNQCFLETEGQYRWTSNDQKVGTCVQCSAVLVPKRSNQCQCSNLFYQGDCASASDSCLWNSENSQCITLPCSILSSRATCISNYNCHWIQYDGLMQCLPFESCSTLPGTNSYQCLAYSLRCTQTDGEFCKELSFSDRSTSCASIKYYTDCFLTVGSDGVCGWNGEQCYALSECSQIPVSELCGINHYACYWNYSSNVCAPLSCEQVTNQKECTYYFSTINFSHGIQMCYWNSTGCQNVTQMNELNSTDCYLNSGKTYRWSSNNGTSGNCDSCSYLKLLEIAIITFLIAN